MAIMRTNRLTSKTTPPKSVTTKERRMIPANELEAQDANYKKYQKDTEVYNTKTKKYNERTKENPTQARNYNPVFQGEQNTRRLSTTEAAEWNKREAAEQGDDFIEEKDINVGIGNYKKFTNGGKIYSGEAGARLSTLVKPTAPKRVDPADWSKVELNKMPTNKATISTPKSKLRDMKVQEFGQFEAPSAVTTKTKTKAAMTGGGDKLVRAKNPSGSLGAARVTTEKTKGAAGYNREKKQFEAFAKPLPSGGSLNVMEDTSPVINRAKADANQLKSAYRKEGNREGVKMMRQEANQLGKAAKFADKMYEKGGGDYFTRDMVKGFRGSDSNPANQNTIERQQKLINSRK